MAESKEPTMEEILASIRRIISEEGEATAQAEARPAAPAPAPAARPDPQDTVDEFFAEAPEETDEATDGVLELTETVQPAEEPFLDAAARDEGLVSEETVVETTRKLSPLSDLLVRNYPGSENTLEGLIREMLRPMLKEWLDAHLPEIVERTVAREVARITGRVAGE